MSIRPSPTAERSHDHVADAPSGQTPGPPVLGELLGFCHINAGQMLLTRSLWHMLLFWMLKTVAVTLGETAGDLFGITFKFGYVQTALVFAAFFLVVVTLQVRARRFYPVLFWSVILGTSLVHRDLRFPGPRSGFGQRPEWRRLRVGSAHPHQLPWLGLPDLASDGADLRRGEHRQPQG
jgi:Repeat of Unknown Function (DUF347)